MTPNQSPAPTEKATMPVNQATPATTPTVGTVSSDRFGQVLKRRAQLVEETASRIGTTRERIPDLGGRRLKLSVRGEIPGHTMYWANDDQGAIEELLMEGFEFVSRGEIELSSHVIADLDVTDRVSRYVGTAQDGSPMRAYLLKATDELWARFQKGAQAQAQEWEDSVRKKRDRLGDGQYIPQTTGGPRVDSNTAV